MSLVDLAARRNFLNNAELVRRLHAVGEHQKAAMLYRSGHAMAQRMNLRSAEQQGDHSAAQREEDREAEDNFAADMAAGAVTGRVGAPERHRAVARIGYTRAGKLGGEDAEGKLGHRYGLQVVPTFEQAIRTKVNKTNLPPLKATAFWNSPAYQALRLC